MPLVIVFIIILLIGYEASLKEVLIVISTLLALFAILDSK